MVHEGGELLVRVPQRFIRERFAATSRYYCTQALMHAGRVPRRAGPLALKHRTPYSTHFLPGVSRFPTVPLAGSDPTAELGPLRFAC